MNKKILIAGLLFSFTSLFSVLFPLKALAESPFSFGYHYKTNGYVYTDTKVPEFLPKEPHLKPLTPNAKEIGIANRQYNGDEESKPPYAGLKKGEASCINVLGLVEMGNAGIKEAAENGNISKIQFVDTRRERLFAYYFFYDKITTIVYGE